VLLSTGMSYFAEVDQAVELFRSTGSPLLLMQCTNRYPCPPEKLGLNLIPEYQKRYGIPVGFSDHSGEIAPGLAAVTLGAKAIEVHVTWHKGCFGPDVKASLTFERFSELVQGVRLLERALNHGVNKDAMAEEMADMRRMFTKGLVARVRIEQGTPLDKSCIDAKKPCIGIPVADYQKALGRTANRAIEANEPIEWSDLL
jgi:N,N'-diacetyllegionaminate synthase